MNEQQLLTQHLTSVYRFALRLTQGDVHRAEDLAQEALLRAWEHRDELTHEKVAIVWLFRTVRRLWVDEGRRAGVRRMHAPRVAEHKRMIRNTANIAQTRPADSDESVELALEFMNQLPQRQREVLHLHTCEGLDTRSIAAVLGISKRAVISSLSLARQTVCDRWKQATSPPQEATST